ncbi:MAG: universal stress protein [Pyrinomonadaceae bacterium]
MKILIATDGSTFSRAAVEKLSEIISNSNHVVRVISSVEPFIPTTPEAYGITTDFYSEAEDKTAEVAEDVVESAARRLKEKFSEIEVQTKVLRGTYPKHAITEEAESWGADLVVVGSHGYGFWDRMLLGSVSDAVVNHSPCSVLVIRGIDEN